MLKGKLDRQQERKSGREGFLSQKGWMKDEGERERTSRGMRENSNITLQLVLLAIIR